MPRQGKALTDKIDDAITNMVTPSEESSGETTVESVLDKITESVDSVASKDTIAMNAEAPNETIGLDEIIPCRSITYGKLLWISKQTNAYYQWNSIGDTEYIPFKELIVLNNTKRDYLFKPYIIVQDPRVVKHFRLTQTYEKVAKIHDLERVFKGPTKEIEKVVSDAINVNMREVVISKIREMRVNGTLTNIDVIRLLERKLGFDLSDDTGETAS